MQGRPDNTKMKIMANGQFGKNFESKVKIPPQSIESEKSLLGSLLLDKDAIWKVVDFLAVDDFYKNSHKNIYKAMVDLTTRKEPIDIRTLSVRLEEMGLLAGVGGYSYLAGIVNAVPTASNALSYARIVQKKRVLRDLIKVSYEISDLGYSEGEDLEKLLDLAEKAVFNIAQKGSAQIFVPLKTTLGPAFQRMASLADGEGGGLAGVPTGFTALDNILAGLQKSDLVVLAARPSYGKSSLALNIARYVAINNKLSVGVFSLEMSKEQVTDRLIASQSRVNLWRIRTGRLSKQDNSNDFDAIGEALGVLSEAPIFIDDSPSPTVLRMKAMARRLKAERDLGLIIVDYLQLIQPDNSREGMVQQVSRISRSLKELAKELNAPVLALSQLSRAVEKRIPPIPRLADLRESGAIEQDADVVIFLNKPDKYDSSAMPNVVELIVAKHRNGPTGIAKVMFNDSIVTFENIAKEEIEEGGEEIEAEGIGEID